MLIERRLKDRDSGAEGSLAEEMLQQKQNAPSKTRALGPGVVGDQKSGKIYLDDILQQFEAAENAVNLELQLIGQRQSHNIDEANFEK